MSGLFTVGREYYKDYSMPLYYSNDNVFDISQNSKERYKMIFVQAGSGIVILNGERHIIAAPVILCLNEVDHYQIEACVGLEAEAIWFHPDIINQNFNFSVLKRKDEELSVTEMQDMFWLNPYCRRADRFTGMLNIAPGSGERFKNIISLLKKELAFQKDQHWPCRSRTYLIELLFLISTMLKVSETEQSIIIDEGSGDMKEVILYLYSNYMKKITIQDLTGIFHINHTTLSKQFNKITGLPVMKYLVELRIYIASQMLRDTLLPISEVMERVGFNDSTHFGRMFKRNYGYSPKAYREKNCWMIEGNECK